MSPSQTSEETRSGTRQRLIDAATRLVAESGLDGASVRSINREAGVGNQSAINYHFGDVWNLISEAARQSAQAYVASMDQLIISTQSRNADGQLTLTDVAEVMIRPIVRMVSSEQGRCQVQLMARMAGDCGQRGRQLLAEGLGPTSLRLSALALAAMPELGKEAAGVKILFAFNTVLNVIPDAGLEAWWPLETTSRDRLDRYLRDYIVGGIVFSSRVSSTAPSGE